MWFFYYYFIQCLEVEAEVGLRLPAGLQHRGWGEYHSNVIWTYNQYSLSYSHLKPLFTLRVSSCRTFNPADYTTDSGTSNSHADVWETGANDTTDGTGERRTSVAQNLSQSFGPLPSLSLSDTFSGMAEHSGRVGSWRLEWRCECESCTIINLLCIMGFAELEFNKPEKTLYMCCPEMFIMFDS